MIVHNTVRMTGKALPVFLDHGRNYATFPNSIELPISLQHMYGGPIQEHRNFIAYLDSQQSLHIQGDPDAYEELFSYCKKIGEGLVVQTGGLNQECERELEDEAEEQNEQEVEIVDYTQGEKQVLADMFEKVRRPRKVVEEILMKRHRLVHFERSELEEFCDRIHG